MGPVLAFYVPLVLITLGYVVIFIWLRKKINKRAKCSNEARLHSQKQNFEMKVISPLAKRLSKVCRFASSLTVNK